MMNKVAEFTKYDGTQKLKKDKNIVMIIRIGTVAEFVHKL